MNSSYSSHGAKLWHNLLEVIARFQIGSTFNRTTYTVSEGQEGMPTTQPNNNYDTRLSKTSHNLKQSFEYQSDKNSHDFCKGTR